MTQGDPIVFLVDVDDTLLENDRIQEDLKRHIEREFGPESRDRFLVIQDDLFQELGYRDYLGTLQRYRVEHPTDIRLLQMSSYLVDYPFANRLYPGALDVLERFRSYGRTVILSDGDVVFQPRKIERSGIHEAVDGHVLIYIHKENALDDVERRYPAERYVLVDDKLRILAAVKKAWGDRVTTVFPRQGKFAKDPSSLAAYPNVADVTVDRIGNLLDYDLADLFRNKPEKARKGMMGMKATQMLHNLGQSLWLDNITRDLLDDGTLQQYINELSVTGLTSNPTIFDHAIKGSSSYDAGIRDELSKGKAGEELFFDLALDDITRAADLFLPIYHRTNTVDGWVSLEVSPLLAHDTASTLAAAKQLFARAARPNLLIKIPGTKEGLPAIEEAIFSGISVNVTLLFSRTQYVAAAEAFLRGIERRMQAGLNPNVGSVASVFVSRWDVAVADKLPTALHNQLGLAVAKQIYRAARELLSSPRWQRIYNVGARPQRLLWASTGTKDPSVSEILYVKGLAAPFTVNTMPEKTLKALAAHNELGSILPADGGECEETLAEFAKTGVDVDALGAQLQDEGAQSFVKSWTDLMRVITSKSEVLRRVA